MHALVIDDSRTMRVVLGRQLEQLGFEVLQAADGQQALDVLASRRDDLPALATVDWNMPVMNGLEFVQAVRADAGLRDITLMMVTTEAEHAQIVRALAAGAHEYLIKPFSGEALVDKLDYLGLNPGRRAEPRGVVGFEVILGAYVSLLSMAATGSVSLVS